MSQRSEVYEELRETVKGLGRLKGRRSTKSVIEHLDDLWSVMIRSRAAMVKTLMNRGEIDSPKDVDPRDFLNLYLQIHNPKRENRLCEHCKGRVEFGISECPYCGEYVNGENSQQFLTGVTIDFQAQDKRPDWDIDTDPTEILNKNKPTDEDIEGLEVIKPITKRDDIIGPTGVGKSRSRRKYTLTRATRNLIAWMRKRELSKHIPYTQTQLSKLLQQDLMLIASILKDKTDLPWPKIAGMKLNELIEFILAYQGTKPIDVGEPPHGELPNLEDIVMEEDSE